MSATATIDVDDDHGSTHGAPSELRPLRTQAPASLGATPCFRARPALFRSTARRRLAHPQAPAVRCSTTATCRGKGGGSHRWDSRTVPRRARAAPHTLSRRPVPDSATKRPRDASQDRGARRPAGLVDDETVSVLTSHRGPGRPDPSAQRRRRLAEASGARRGQALLRALGDRQGHRRRHRRRGRHLAGPRSTACSPAARTCCSRRCASARPTDFFDRARRPPRSAPTRSRTCWCAVVVDATRQLRADEHLQLMLASEPGEVARRADRRRPAASSSARHRVPRAAGRPATSASRALGRAGRVARPASCISYFLAPSQLRRPRRPRRRPPRFVASFVLPAFPPLPPRRGDHHMSVSTEDDHRPRRDQRHRGHPGGHQHRRRRGRARRHGQRRRHLHVGLLAGPAGAAQALREGQDRPVERHHRPAVGHRGRPRGRSSRPTRPRSAPASTPTIYIGTAVEKWGDKEWLEFGMESRRWTLSQFLHGEQGALLCTAKIVETVPWYDAKLYASTQVVDEARHVEVFARYLDEKLGGAVPDQRPPADAARRHRQRQPLGHDLPRHAGDGRGPGAGRLRLHAPDHRASRCSSSCCAT